MTPAPLTVSEVAERLRVSVATVLAWLASGELVGSDVSRTRKRREWRICESALADFLELRAVEPRPKRARRPRLPQPREYVF